MRLDDSEFELVAEVADDESESGCNATTDSASDSRSTNVPAKHTSIIAAYLQQTMRQRSRRTATASHDKIVGAYSGQATRASPFVSHTRNNNANRSTSVVSARTNVDKKRYFRVVPTHPGSRTLETAMQHRQAACRCSCATSPHNASPVFMMSIGFFKETHNTPTEPERQ
jgi:hypothetical protein